MDCYQVCSNIANGAKNGPTRGSHVLHRLIYSAGEVKNPFFAHLPVTGNFAISLRNSVKRHNSGIILRGVSQSFSTISSLPVHLGVDADTLCMAFLGEIKAAAA